MKKLIFAISLAALSYTGKAEGYQVNTQSQKNVSMGHTGAGLMLGSSSVHFNPGALALMQKKYDFSFGGTLVFSKVTYSKYDSNYQAETDSPTGTPFYFYGARKLSDKFVLSLGITTPYGNSLAWDKEWDGRYLIQDISLQAIVAQPTLSYKINDKLGFGIGAMVVYGAVDLNRALPVGSAEESASVNLKGNKTSFGFNTGIYYQASEAFSVGLNYRSKVKVKLEGGDVTFTGPESLYDYAFPRSTKFDAELPLPANLTLGMGYKLNKKLTLAADFQYVFWNAYEELNFDFESELVADSNNPRNYDNTLIYRLGAEYILNNIITIRAGAYFDETPISDDYLNPETPGMNKVGLSFGGSIAVNDKLTVDASFLYILGIERTSQYKPAGFKGTYNSRAIIPGIGLTYSF